MTASRRGKKDYKLLLKQYCYWAHDFKQQGSTSDTGLEFFIYDGCHNRKWVKSPCYSLPRLSNEDLHSAAASDGPVSLVCFCKMQAVGVGPVQ